MSKVKLYHGSDMIVKRPIRSKGKIHNDYGQGFYCTKHIELAKKWAVDENRDGFVNEYVIDDKGMNILNLNDSSYSILHWLTLLLEHRTINVKNPILSDGMEYLIKYYHIDISGYDMIIGYRADDSYFSFARAFISNSISISQLERAMYLGELGQQYFIQSDKAFEALDYIASLSVDSSQYYPLKVSRDRQARDNYQKLTEKMDVNATYLIDLIREETSL